MEEGMLRRAQSLRKNATKEENDLWYKFLRNYPVQWKRQKVIAGYIVDFYCSRAKLVVELDGSQHYEKDAMEYDRVRTEILNSLEIQVIRFTNLDISRNFPGVCQAIDREVRVRLGV
jgi:very-short-patch-repair endonuclease